jgi:hypothetical protein
MNKNQDMVEFSNQSSIKISKTSTNKVSWDVKAYGNTPEEIQRKLSELIEIAKTKERQI